MIAAGIDVRTVAGRLGHGQPWTTLNTYAAFVPERDRAAADYLAALLAEDYEPCGQARNDGRRALASRAWGAPRARFMSTKNFRRRLEAF
jgi:hypothetical protein